MRDGEDEDREDGDSERQALGQRVIGERGGPQALVREQAREAEDDRLGREDRDEYLQKARDRRAAPSGEGAEPGGGGEQEEIGVAEMKRRRRALAARRRRRPRQVPACLVPHWSRRIRAGRRMRRSNLEIAPLAWRAGARFPAISALSGERANAAIRRGDGGREENRLCHARAVSQRLLQGRGGRSSLYLNGRKILPARSIAAPPPPAPWLR